MIKFLRLYGNDRLYAADGGPGRLYFIVPAGAGTESIALSDAWSSKTLAGTFAYARGDTGLTAVAAGDFVQAVLDRVAQAGAERGFVWLADPGAWQHGALGPGDAPLLGMDAAGMSVQVGLDAPVVTGVRLTVAAQSGLTFTGADVTIAGPVAFTGPHAPAAAVPVSTAVLGLSEEDLGSLAFSVFLTRSSLRDQACWGFQFGHPAAPGSPVQQSEWLPLADGAPAADGLGFAAVLDPSDSVNCQARLAAGPNRSRLAFTGKNADGTPTELVSCLRTRQGTAVTLVPVASPQQADRAALVFNPGVPDDPAGPPMQLAPAGDFEMAVAGLGAAGLLCGLNGTEIITFMPRQQGKPGDRLRFRPYQAAYAPRYPFPDASPVAAPADASLPLLDQGCTTSWVSVLAGAGIPVTYTAQPRGASLYGQLNPIWALETGLMGWQAPSSALSQGACFPLVPYAGLPAGTAEAVQAAETAADFERQIIGPVRRSAISAVAGPAGPAAGAYTAVTAGGMLVTVDGGRWTRILLGQTADPPLALCFADPAPELQEAFESGDLFLVAANEAPLGHQVRGSGSGEDGASLFANTIQISGWELSARVGRANHYGDYRNVLIVKGRQGNLYNSGDPAGSLVANPERWTRPALFAAPSDLVTNPEPPPAQTLQPPDPAETVVLSQWLQDYFATAASTGGEALARFNAIAADPAWTGILILRMDIAAVPDDLAGIMAGITDPDGFAAHHLAIELTPASAKQGSLPGPTVTGPSSIFGLIDYADPAFTVPLPGEPVRPVAPAPGAAYDFRLLWLQASFANTAISSFRSYAQLTAASWFDTPVTGMGEGGNPYRAIVLDGTLQANNGQPVYSMSSAADTTFLFDHDVLASVEITRADMSTRNTGRELATAGAASPLTSSWFSLTGYLDFRKLRAGPADGDGPDRDFDVFSFGSQPADGGDQGAPDQGAARTGLAFANLGILLSFPPEDPTASRLTLEPAEIRFETATSTARPASLARQFALEVAGLVSGSAASPPGKLGYAQVVTDARLEGVDGGRWWGIAYRLPLGTPGNLAGRTGLTAQLLTAWSAASRSARGTGSVAAGSAAYRAAVGLQLPGSGGLISLQNVVKLSCGQIWLRTDPGNGAFLLLLSELTVKLFGLLSVPPGATLCYLYGDLSASGGSPSGLGWYAMYRKDAG